MKVLVMSIEAPTSIGYKNVGSGETLCNASIFGDKCCLTCGVLPT